jgi:hypothetical protein
MPEPEDKPFAIPRPLVWGAWRRTVGQGDLPRVGDVDLFAADAPGLRTGLLSLSVPRAPLTHARQPYSRLACLSCGAGSPPASERKVCA